MQSLHYAFHTLTFIAIPGALANQVAQLLGLEKDASERQIKKAYRNLSKKYHPDKNPYAQYSTSPPAAC